MSTDSPPWRRSSANFANFGFTLVTNMRIGRSTGSSAGDPTPSRSRSHRHPVHLADVALLHVDIETGQLRGRELPIPRRPADRSRGSAQCRGAGTALRPHQHVLHRPDARRLVLAGDLKLGLVTVMGRDERADVGRDALDERIEPRELHRLLRVDGPKLHQEVGEAFVDGTDLSVLGEQAPEPIPVLRVENRK